MFEHPQMFHDRYIAEVERLNVRNERIRIARERAGQEFRPRRGLRGLFHRRDRGETAPVTAVPGVCMTSHATAR